jgi:hypothetical protein
MMELNDRLVEDIKNTLIWTIQESNNPDLMEQCRDILKHLNGA